MYPLLHLLATAASGEARDELLAVAADPLALPDGDAVRVVTPAGGPPLTTVTVQGGDGIDVVLLLGEPDLAPGEVLAAGIGTPRTGPGPLHGPGIELVLGSDPAGTYLTVPRFTVTGEHDLLTHAELFGLRTATDASRGHFPGIGPEPLAVGRCPTQAATASFTALGFRAAAVSVVDLLAGGIPVHDQEQLHVTFDRPFGFLAVHRATGLVLFAGWVDAPTPWEPESILLG